MRSVFLWLFWASGPVLGMPCWDAASTRHGVSPRLLYAIARVESGLDPSAINRGHVQRTGSYDIGLMQINSRHLPMLARHGIDEDALLDACTNLHVGAWLLADLFARHGDTWEAVGAYNAACTQLKGDRCLQARAAYAWKVYRRLPDSLAHARTEEAVGAGRAMVPDATGRRVP